MEVELCENMEVKLNLVHDWLVTNKLTPNRKKCESIFFTNSPNSKAPTSRLNVEMS